MMSDGMAGTQGGENRQGARHRRAATQPTNVG